MRVLWTHSRPGGGWAPPDVTAHDTLLEMDKASINIDSTGAAILNAARQRPYLRVMGQHRWETCGRDFSDTIVPSPIPVLVVASRTLLSNISSAIQYVF